MLPARKLVFTIFFLVFHSFSQTAPPPSEAGETPHLPVRTLPTMKVNQDDDQRRNRSKIFDILDAKNIRLSTDVPSLLSKQVMGFDTFQNTLYYNGISEDATKILINHIPLLSMDKENFFINLFPTSFLDRVVFIQGAGSTLYGSGASVGVLNLLTLPPKANLSLETEAFYGAYGSAGGNLVVSDTRKAFKYKVGLDYLWDNGFKKENRLGISYVDLPSFNRFSGLWNMSYHFAPNHVLTLSLLHTFKTADRSSEDSPYRIQNDEQNNTFLSLAYSKEIDDKNLFESFFSFQENILKKRTTADRVLIQGRGYNGDAYFQNALFHGGYTYFFTPTIQQVILLDYALSAMDSSLIDQSHDDVYILKKIRHEVALALQYPFDFNRLSFAFTGRATYHTGFQFNFSPSFSIKYSDKRHFMVGLDYGRSFITPTFKENYYRWMHPAPRFLIKGNEKLKAETGDNLQISTALWISKFIRWDATGFLYVFYNKIEQASQIDGTKSGVVDGQFYQGEVNTVNKYNTLHTGLNSKLSSSLLDDKLHLFVGYTYLYGVEKENTRQKHYTKAYLISPNKVKWGIDYQIPRLKTKLSLYGSWNDQREYLSTSILGKGEKRVVKAFTQLSLGIIQPLFQVFNLYVQIDNALNAKDPNYLAQEGIKVKMGFFFSTDDLSKTHQEIQNGTLPW